MLVPGLLVYRIEGRSAGGPATPAEHDYDGPPARNQPGLTWN